MERKENEMFYLSFYFIILLFVLILFLDATKMQ